MKSSTAILYCALLAAAPSFAAEPPAEVPGDAEQIAEVNIAGVRDPELKPYRVMSAGMDAFDEFHRLAPQAALQFRLSRRGDQNWDSAIWDGVSLRLAGNETSIPIPIAADGRFSLPRSKEAYDEDADLILNQKKSLVRFSVDVRTPGLPANTRRLGDIRLECQVMMAIGKKEMGLARRAVFNTIFMGGDWCASKRARFGIALPDWSMGATIADGGKRIPVASYGYSASAPIHDKSLSDNALIEFELWSAASAERKQQLVATWPLYVKTSANKWGPGPVFRPSGNGSYSAVLSFKPGQWDVNLETAGREFNLGGSAGGILSASGAAQPLRWHGTKMKFAVAQAGPYEFLLNLEDPDRPSLIVRPGEAR